LTIISIVSCDNSEKFRPRALVTLRVQLTGSETTPTDLVELGAPISQPVLRALPCTGKSRRRI